jgi:methylated-DNA-[protein]-cysteine S-methyltransferase
MRYIRTETPIGTLTILGSDAGVRGILWDGELPPQDATEQPCPPLTAAADQLREYFEGTRRSFDLPLDVVGTPFQRRAWQELTRIPFGETISYAEQARRVGSPRAARAVGSANGANPIPIVQPCHRVVAAGGGLGGFGGGLGVKQTLLDHEARVLGGERPR